MMQLDEIQRKVPWKLVLIAAFLGIFASATIRVVRKVRKPPAQNRTAFLRWKPFMEQISRGESPYLRNDIRPGQDEGYPSLPMMAVLIRPLYRLGDMGASLVFLGIKCLFCVAILAIAMAAARGPGPPVPSAVQVLILALSVRVFLGDLTHGNSNLVVGMLFAATLWFTVQGQDLLAGLAAALATVAKATPAILLLYFLYKRRWRCVAGYGLGLVLFLWVVPGLVLGFSYNQELLAGWTEQMLGPMVSGGPFMYKLYHNQSFMGVSFRLLQETLAAVSERGYPDLYVNLTNWSDRQIHWVVWALSGLTLGVLAWTCRVPKDRRRHLGTLGEFALVFLAMCFLSPRTWKHHFVLLILSHTFLLYYLIHLRPTGWRRWLPLAGLVLGLLCTLASGEALLGFYASNVAEAYGVYLWGGLSFFVGSTAALVALRQQGWPAPPEGSPHLLDGRSDL